MTRKKLLHLLGIGCVSFAAGLICGKLSKAYHKKSDELEDEEPQNDEFSDYISDDFYYGRSRKDNTLIFLNRKEMPYYGSGVLTGAGCGHRHPVMKREMENVLKHTDDDVIMISYFDGYLMDNMLERFDGRVVDVYRNALIRLNPMKAVSKDSLSAKTEECKALFKVWLMAHGETLRPADEKAMEESIKTLYERKNHPTIYDLMEELKKWPDHSVAERLDGITDYFHVTDETETKSRLTVYDADGMFRPDTSAELAMITSIGDAWERVCENTRHGKHTWLYIADCRSDVVKKIEPYVTKLMKSGKDCTITLTCVELPSHEENEDTSLEHNFGIFFPSGDEKDSETKRMYVLNDEEITHMDSIRPGDGMISYVPSKGAERVSVEFSY